MTEGTPERSSNSRAERFALGYFGAMAALGAALLLAETAVYGVGVSPDSVEYIANARSVTAPGGGASIVEGGFVSQPPGYPLLLAAIARATGADPFEAARGANALLFAISSFIACALLVVGQVGRLHPLIAVTAPLFVLSSRSLHAVFGMAWSEPLFVALAVAFLACLCRYLRRGDTASLALAGGLAVAAMLTRYSGVTFIATGVLVISLAPGVRRRRFAAAAKFGLATAVVFGAWVARNLTVAGTAFGERPAAVHSLRENLVLSLRVFQAHFFPESGDLSIASKLAISAGVAILVLWALAPRASQLRAALWRERALVVPCAAFACVAVSFTIVTSSIVAYDPINFRLLAPAYLPLFLLAALLANAALQAPGQDGRRFARAPVVMALLVVLALVQPLRQYALDHARRRASGEGLSGAAWSGSELLAAVGSWPGRASAAAIFSNVPSALAWHLGIDAHNAPRSSSCPGLGGAAARACFEANVDSRFRGARLVYFTTQHYPYYYTLEELAAFVELTPMLTAGDGGVYRVAPRAPPPAP